MFLIGRRPTVESDTGPASQAPPAAHYYHFDGLGSTSLLTDDGGQTTDVYSSDAGNMMAKGATAYTWNWMGKLASVDEGATNVATYLYNGAGLRVQKMVGGTTTEFLYDSGEVVAEVVGTNVTHYVGLGMDIISRIEGTSRKVFHADGLGSTHALTDASSAVTGAADYDAWGNILVTAGDPAPTARPIYTLAHAAASALVGWRDIAGHVGDTGESTT